jgi:heterodisulfide reductase subunit C
MVMGLTTLSKDKLAGNLLKKVVELSGQNVFACYQCGKCSAGCPLVSVMDLLPNQVIRLAQLGEIEEVLKSNTIWLCASCFTCGVRCPKGVDLAKIMEALRQIILRKNIDKISLRQIKKEELEELPQIALVSAFRKATA